MQSACIDAANCYICSVVCVSVSVCWPLICESCKNGQTNRGAVWDGESGAFKEPSIRLGGGSHHVSGHFYRGYAWACPDLPAIDILNVVRQGAAGRRRTQHTCS